MTQVTSETVRIVEKLPEDKALALLEYARYLAERVDEEAWQRRFRDKNYAPKLKSAADQALAEHRSGKTKLLTPRSTRGNCSPPTSAT